MRFSECTCRLRLVGCRLSLACDEGAAFATLHYMGWMMDGRAGRQTWQRHAYALQFIAPELQPCYSSNSTRLVTSRHDTYDVSSRVCSNMADDEETVVLECTSLVFCALDLHQAPEQLPEKVRWTCPPQSTLWRRPWTRVVRFVPVVTGGVAPCCPTSATRLVPTFPYTEMHGLGSVSCRDVTWRDEPSRIWACGAPLRWMEFVNRPAWPRCPVARLAVPFYTPRSPLATAARGVNSVGRQSAIQDGPQKGNYPLPRVISKPVFSPHRRDVLFILASKNRRNINNYRLALNIRCVTYDVIYCAWVTKLWYR